MPVIEQFRKDLRKKESRWLTTCAANVTSQAGEDGVRAKVFEVLGEQSRWCVEFGAWDGRLYSNTYDLIAARGWSGVLIEASTQKFEDLKRTYAGNPRAICVNAIVQPSPGPGSLDATLATTEIPREFDLLSIDIDGNDYHVWESLASYRPRVVVIEFNRAIPNDILFIQDPDIAINQGCSLRALIALGKRKGYELAAVVGTNAMFVMERDFGKLGIADNDIDAMFLPMSDGKYFDGYDGTLYHIGLPRLHWKRVAIGVDDLQVLWRAERRYGDAIATRRFGKWKRRVARFIRTRSKALNRMAGW